MPKRKKHWDSVARLCGHAMRNGGERLSQMRFRWDISGKCQSGYCTELYGAPEGPREATRVCEVYPLDKGPDCPPEPPEVWLAGGLRISQRKHIGVARGTAHPLMLELITPCRRCDPCRKDRARLWTYRARVEVQSSVRTWLGTLTLRPEEHSRYGMIARDRFAVEPGEFERALTIGQQLVHRHNAISPELTMFLKRVRKNSGAQFRYLLVMEAHKSMLPHYHLLLHETDPAVPVRKTVLDAAWRLGFGQWRLVDTSQPWTAVYLCKYLSKSSAARVRASLAYGESDGSSSMERSIVALGSADTKSNSFHNDNVNLTSSPSLAAREHQSSPPALEALPVGRGPEMKAKKRSG